MFKNVHTYLGMAGYIQMKNGWTLNKPMASLSILPSEPLPWMAVLLNLVTFVNI